MLGALLAIVLGLEFYVRSSIDHGMHFDLEMWKYANQLKQVSSNPKLGHEHRPNSSAFLMGVDVHINRRKLRDQDYDYERPPGIRRILMLGDSITFGWGVPVEHTVSKHLERLLQESGHRVEVINTGVGNYNTTMEVEYFLTEGYRFDPQVVVLNFFINDAEPTPTYTPLTLLQRHSHAYVWLTGRVDVVFRHLDQRQTWWEYYRGLYNSPGWKAAEESIARLATYCHRNGIGLLIANYPELREMKHYRFDRVRTLVQEAAEGNGTTYLDLYEAVRNEEAPMLWVTEPDPHPSRHAHKLFAESMLPTIEDMLDRHHGKRQQL